MAMEGRLMVARVKDGMGMAVGDNTSSLWRWGCSVLTVLVVI